VPAVLATWQVEIRKILVQDWPGQKSKDPKPKSKKDWRLGLTGRALAKGQEFKPHYHKNTLIKTFQVRNEIKAIRILLVLLRIPLKCCHHSVKITIFKILVFNSTNVYHKPDCLGRENSLCSVLLHVCVLQRELVAVCHLFPSSWTAFQWQEE
jgi:hypothetical protein